VAFHLEPPLVVPRHSEGFVEPLEGFAEKRMEQAHRRKQNLDSLSYATEGCSVEDPKGVRAFQALYPKGVRAFQALYPKGPLTRISKLRKGNPTTNETHFGWVA